jgi:hypothetical protein
MKLSDIINSFEKDLYLIEELVLGEDFQVDNWIDRAGQLSGIKSPKEAGYDNLGRAVAVVNNKTGGVQVFTGSMQQDHNKLGPPNGLRFFWGIKGKSFLFTGKNADDLDSLYRADRMLAGQEITKPGQVVANVIGSVMDKVGAKRTEGFKKVLVKKLTDEGVLKG